MAERMRELLARHWVVVVAGLIVVFTVVACGGSDAAVPTLQPTAAAVQLPAEQEDPTEEPEPTDTLEPADTPSPSPQIMCTAPACGEDELLFCPGDCPGGCGHICATVTLEPTITAKPTDTPTPSADPTASWNVYSTSTYTIRYPADVELKERDAGGVSLSKFGPTQVENTEIFDALLLAFQTFESSNVDLETYVDGQIKALNPDNEVIKLISGAKPTAIGNYSGYTFTIEGVGTFKYTYLQSTDKTMIVEIIDGTIDPGNLGFEDLVSQIQSTFEFIEG
jgi:hypothetical protein